VVGDSAREYLLERVDDAAVVQVYADGFARLARSEKILAWHLYRAAIAGRDIYYDQRHRLALVMRDVLEAILTAAPKAAAAGDPIEPATLADVERYTKLFWINSGPYNNLTARKFVLSCSPQQFVTAARIAARAGGRFPARPGETLEQLLARLQPMFFDPACEPMVTAKTPPPDQDILGASANNLYRDVTTRDLEGYAERYPLNSRLVKRDERLVEEVYRVNGRYGRQIAEVVRHLNAAIAYAPPATARALGALVIWYETGEVADRIAYDIAWVEDQNSPIDTLNGFIEVYLDARGVKGAWASLVSYVNQEKTGGIQRLAAAAQWFEDRMPWAPEYRKSAVRGVTANAIDVVIETGDAGPISALGINLPNDQAIREQHGSKSVSLANIADAYDRSTLPAFRSEFAWTAEEAERDARWGALASELMTNMHEVIGHGSGKVADRVDGRLADVLKEQYSSLEEARSDLVALYFLPNPKLVELGLIDQAHHEAIVRTEYERYARMALVQLRRMRQGTHLEEDHMRNRQMIVSWLTTNTDAIEVRTRDGKTYYVVTDIAAFHEGVGRLLAEVQRIKSEGDYESAKALFDAHGVHFEPALRDEVVARVDALQLPSYTGFVMPSLQPLTNDQGEIVDIEISYPRDLTRQMLEYAHATRELRG
jgi:dipeptidyl-peptidase-3